MAVEHEDQSYETLDEYPEVELDWAHDDTDSPATLTIFHPDERHIESSWITVQSEASINLAEMQ